MYPMNRPSHDTALCNGALVPVVRVVINAGHLSVDNGATAPMSVFFDLKKLLNTEAEMGDTYGQDCLLVPESDWPTVEAMLIDAKLVYRLAGPGQPWQNVREASVRARLGSH